MAFEELIGNENVKEVLQDLISSENYLHSYLFCGEDGVGKKLFAKEFSKYILCGGRKTGENSHEQIENGNHPDFQIVIPDGNSIKIEQIRNMQESIYNKPILSNRKVYIIDDSQKMTKDAQNALLKTLEEPPEYVTIILICSNENLLLNTIISRLIKIPFKPIRLEELKKYNEKVHVIASSSEILLKMINGSIGRMYSIQGKEAFYGSCSKVFASIDESSMLDFFQKTKEIYESKEDIDEVLNLRQCCYFRKSKRRL